MREPQPVPVMETPQSSRPILSMPRPVEPPILESDPRQMSRNEGPSMSRVKLLNLIISTMT